MWPKGLGKRWEGDDLAQLTADVCTINRNNKYSLSIYMANSIGVDYQILKIELKVLELATIWLWIRACRHLCCILEQHMQSPDHCI